MQFFALVIPSGARNLNVQFFAESTPRCRSLAALGMTLLHSSVLSSATIRALVLVRVARRRLRAATPFVSIGLLVHFERGVIALVATAIGRMNSLGGFRARSGFLASILVSHTCSHR